MAVKQGWDDPEVVALRAPMFTLGLVQLSGRTASEDRVTGLLRTIVADKEDLNERVIAAVGLLAETGAWSEAIRVVVGLGGYQMAEISQALGVMRSTVTRWYTCETTPSPDQIKVYFGRLIDYMRLPRRFEIQSSPENLIR